MYSGFGIHLLSFLPCFFLHGLPECLINNHGGISHSHKTASHQSIYFWVRENNGQMSMNSPISTTQPIAQKELPLQKSRITYWRPSFSNNKIEKKTLILKLNQMTLPVQPFLTYENESTPSQIMVWRVYNVLSQQSICGALPPGRGWALECYGLIVTGSHLFPHSTGFCLRS